MLNESTQDRSASSLAADEAAAAVPLAQRGDRDAAERLYHLHAARVQAFADRSFESREDARDAVQDVFLRMLDGLPDYRPTGAPFIGWLLRIARNRAIDHRRQFGRLQLDPEPVTGSAPTPAEQSHASFEQLIAGLTLAQQQVLFLRFACALSTTDMARVLDRSEDSIRHIQQRALDRLRGSLTKTQQHGVPHSNGNGNGEVGGHGAKRKAVVAIAER